MGVYTDFTVWFWDDALTALGSTTDALFMRYKCAIDVVGEGEFWMPLVHTPARQYIEKYNIATFTCQIDGTEVCFGEIVIERIQEQLIPGKRGILKVFGRGRMSKLQLDRMNYQIISDGSGGEASDPVGDILALSQYATWSGNTRSFSGSYVNADAYLVTANETLFDAVIQALNQKDHHLMDIPGQIDTIANPRTPVNTIWTAMAMKDLDPVVPGGYTGPHFKDDADDDPAVKEFPILDIEPIKEERELATRAIVHGGGLGSGQFTISAASGTKTAPTGFSYDFTNSVITNTTLEAVANQPVKVALAKLSNIKPQDPANSTAVLTAAEKLVDAGQLWIEERDGGFDTYYRIRTLCKVHNTVTDQIPFPGLVTGARLEVDIVSPYDSAGAENDTTILSIDSIFHILEAEWSASAGSGESDNKLFGTYLLGPAPRQERDYGAEVAHRLKEMNRRLDHADASAATSTAPEGQNYVTVDAHLLTAVSSSALANERAGTDGLGTIFTDNGVGTTFQYDIRTPLNVGNGSTNSAGTTSTGHTHAIDIAVGDLPAHDIVGAQHSGTGSQYDIVGFTGTNTLGILTPVSNSTPATEAILKSDSSGGLRLQNITTDGGATFNEDGGNSNFRVESQNKPDFFFIDADQDILLIGDTTLDTRFPTDTWLQSIDGNIGITADGSNAIFSSLVYGAPTWKTSVQARSARGTRASPTASQSGDTFARWGGGGYTGSAFSTENTAYLEAVASQNWSVTANGSTLEYWVTPDDSTTAVNNWKMTSEGVLQFIDSAVLHGMTNQAPTDVYGQLLIRDTSAGGLEVAGYRDADGTAGEALTLVGRLDEAANTAKSTAGLGVVHVISQISNGAGVQAVGANGNLFSIRNHTNTRFIVDAEGDVHLDGTTNDNAWDAWDDVHLARAFMREIAPGSVIDSEFDKLLKYRRDDLIEAGIMHESGFYNFTRLVKLLAGAAWQAFADRQEILSRVESLERKLING